ncbi:MAG: helix-turn-helix transcriptional regulator [Myxococcales bacterium]|nr:helix-turn-helix transcriptional regulator [Myxococcales bacterium]
MGDFRYPQFCPFARAAEILGHRWTILILRNMAAGPQRFRDLKEGLRGVSSSVLATRLDELTARGILRQRILEPPASATVYELTEAGQALAPVLMELARWGVRFMEPPEPGDQIETGWARSALVLFKRWESSPAVALEIRLAGPGDERVVTVRGGPDGTSVENVGGQDVQATLRAAPADLIGALLGHFRVDDAVADGRIQLDGDPVAAAQLPELFDLDRRRLGLSSAAPEPTSP